MSPLRQPSFVATPPRHGTLCFRVKTGAGAKLEFTTIRALTYDELIAHLQEHIKTIEDLKRVEADRG